MNATRLVLKFGSGILANSEGSGLDETQFQSLSAAVAELTQKGYECILVSSGAVAAGLTTLGLKQRPDALAERQACAAVGQSRLMQSYATHFAPHGINVAQLLITYHDLNNDKSYANARNTLDQLFKYKNVVPIINENDSVAVEELNFGDNDRLSAEVAILSGAKILILLTSVDGLQDAGGKIVPHVVNIEDVTTLIREDKGTLSVGGMATKLQAAKLATDAGIATYIANGRKPSQIAEILAGKAVGTSFAPKQA